MVSTLQARRKDHDEVPATHPFTVSADWDEEGCWWAVISAFGNVEDVGEATSTPDGLTTLVEVCHRFADPATGELPAFVLESTRRPMFAALQAHGIEVQGISANNLWPRRAGRKKSKSDRNDAIAIGRRFRSDTSDFHPIPRRTADGTALALLARQEKDAAIRAQQDAGRVRSILTEFYPAPLGAWTLTDLMHHRQTAGQVLRAAPTPAEGRALSLEAITEIIRATGKRSSIDKEAARAYEALSREFIQYPVEAEQHYAAMLLTALGALEQSVATATALEKQLVVLVEDHPWTRLIEPAVGAGPKVIARLIGEMSDDKDRFPSLKELAAFAGSSPVDKSSHKRQDGERRDVKGNRLHRALWDWAESARQNSPGAMHVYWSHRRDGDGHPTAIRKVMFKLTGRMHYCITQGVTWDEAHAWPNAPTKEDATALRDEVRKVLNRRRRTPQTRPTAPTRLAVDAAAP